MLSVALTPPSGSTQARNQKTGGSGDGGSDGPSEVSTGGGGEGGIGGGAGGSGKRVAFVHISNPSCAQRSPIEATYTDEQKTSSAAFVMARSTSIGPSSGDGGGGGAYGGMEGDADGGGGAGGGEGGDADAVMSATQRRGSRSMTISRMLRHLVSSVGRSVERRIIELSPGRPPSSVGHANARRSMRRCMPA